MRDFVAEPHTGIVGENQGTIKLGHTEKVEGFCRLDRFVRMVETKLKPEADFKALIRHENAISRSVGGRTVFDDSAREL